MSKKIQAWHVVEIVFQDALEGSQRDAKRKDDDHTSGTLKVSYMRRNGNQLSCLLHILFAYHLATAVADFHILEIIS